MAAHARSSVYSPVSRTPSVESGLPRWSCMVAHRRCHGPLFRRSPPRVSRPEISMVARRVAAHLARCRRQGTLGQPRPRVPTRHTRRMSRSPTSLLCACDPSRVSASTMRCDASGARLWGSAAVGTLNRCCMSEPCRACTTSWLNECFPVRPPARSVRGPRGRHRGSCREAQVSGLGRDRPRG